MQRKPSRRILESMCGQPTPEDGIDPRDYFKPSRQKHDRRKDWQLCRQVFETLNYVLSGDSHDDVRRGLLVCEVTPAPDATRVLVSVQSLDRGDIDPVVILQRLQGAMGRLRAEVARSISRRKVPELAFRVVPNSPSELGTGATQ